MSQDCGRLQVQHASWCSSTCTSRGHDERRMLPPALHILLALTFHNRSDCFAADTAAQDFQRSWLVGVCVKARAYASGARPLQAIRGRSKSPDNSAGWRANVIASACKVQASCRAFCHDATSSAVQHHASPKSLDADIPPISTTPLAPDARSGGSGHAACAKRAPGQVPCCSNLLHVRASPSTSACGGAAVRSVSAAAHVGPRHGC